MEVVLAAYTKATMRAVDKYVKANYDRIEVKVPKGQKQAIELFAREQGESVNAMVNRLIRTEMDITEDEWKEDASMLSLAQVRRTLKEHGYRLEKKHRNQDSWCIYEMGTDVHAYGFEGGWDAPGLTLDAIQDMIDNEFWHV